MKLILFILHLATACAGVQVKDVNRKLADSGQAPLPPPTPLIAASNKGTANQFPGAWSKGSAEQATF